MTDVSHALDALNITGWSLLGDPTSEKEFNQMFKKHTGVDEHGVAIESDDPADFGVTWDQIVEKQTELQAEYDAKQYQRDRKISYPEIREQLDLLYHDMTAGKGDKTGEWYKAVNKVKTDNPKPE